MKPRPFRQGPALARTSVETGVAHDLYGKQCQDGQSVVVFYVARDLCCELEPRDTAVESLLVSSCAAYPAELKLVLLFGLEVVLGSRSILYESTPMMYLDLVCLRIVLS